MSVACFSILVHPLLLHSLGTLCCNELFASSCMENSLPVLLLFPVWLQS